VWDASSTVTDVRSHRRGSRRRTVWVDGEVWRSMPVEVLRELGLRPGDSIDPPAAELEAAGIEPRLARERALRLLQYRERSTQELLGRLIDDGYLEESADATVEWLTSTGLLDDRRFAEGYARTLVLYRGLGRMRALREMGARGLSDDLAIEALDAIAPEEDEERRALATAVRLHRQGDTPQRLAARLARRGFPARAAFGAARQIVREDPSSEFPEGLE